MNAQPLIRDGETTYAVVFAPRKVVTTGFQRKS